MMNFDYSALQAKATSIITKFGQAVTYRVKGGTYNPAAGSITTPTNTDTTRRGVIFDYTSIDQANMSGELIQAGDRRCYLDGTADVAKDNELIVGGQTYRIMRANRVDPAGTTVIYDLHLRGVK